MVKVFQCQKKQLMLLNVCFGGTSVRMGKHAIKVRSNLCKNIHLSFIGSDNQQCFQEQNMCYIQNINGTLISDQIKIQ